MGIEDRDYWRERYNENLNARRDPSDNPFMSGKSEMSFLSKFILTISLLLIAVLSYRYQSEILHFLQGSPVAVPKRPVVQMPELKVLVPRGNATEKPRADATGQIYRCGNTYSNTPCEGGKQIAQPSGGPSSREIYLCKDFQSNLTWESLPCSTNGRFMDRIARVPTNVSWEEQVAIARQQRDRAQAIASEQVVPVATRPTRVNTNTGECQALDERVNWLDSLGRIGGGGYTMDWIREERRKARDRQFRIGC
jgi:hypothetical protein